MYLTFRFDRATAGMSLVEVMVAIMIFSFGALAVLTMTSGSFNANSHSEAVDIASNLARRQVETVLSQDFDAVVDRTGDGVNGLADSSHHDPGTPLDPDIADYSETLDETSGLGLKRRYDVFWNIAENTPETWAKTVSVNVVWQGKTGTRSMSFMTIWTE